MSGRSRTSWSWKGIALVAASVGASVLTELFANQFVSAFVPYPWNSLVALGLEVSVPFATGTGSIYMVVRRSGKVYACDCRPIGTYSLGRNRRHSSRRG